MTSNRYLVIIDNGESYSDHHHFPICVCDTEKEANNIAKSFNDWMEKAKDIHYRVSMNVDDESGTIPFRDHPLPAPFTPRNLHWDDYVFRCYHMYYSASVLPIPLWANI